MARGFNGSSDSINTSASNTLSPSTYSMSAWFISNFASSYGTIIGKDGGGNGVNVYIKSSKKLAVYAVTGSYDGSGSQTSRTGWNHVGVAINSGGSYSSYLNGALDSSGTGLSSSGANSGSITRFGDDGSGSNLLGGRIADVAIWNGILSAAEFAALSNGARPYTIRPSLLVGYWPLDGLQSPEPDLSGNAFNGTLAGTASAFGPPNMMFTPRWPEYWLSGALAQVAGYPANWTITVTI